MAPGRVVRTQREVSWERGIYSTTIAIVITQHAHVNTGVSCVIEPSRVLKTLNVPNTKQPP